MSLSKTRINPPKNNNRFLVTVKFLDGREKPYHTFTLKNYTDEEFEDWLHIERIFLEESKDAPPVELDKVEWVDNEGIRYKVTGY